MYQFHITQFSALFGERSTERFTFCAAVIIFPSITHKAENEAVALSLLNMDRAIRH